MSGLFIETSLGEALLLLLKILVIGDLLAIIVGILTLPLFLLVLLIVNTWFWAVDEVRTGGDSAAEPGLARRLLARAVVWGLPAISFATTIFLGAFFFGNQGESGDSDNPRKAPWGKLVFDARTREIAQMLAGAGDRAADAPASDQDAQEQKLKGKLRLVRTVGMIGMLVIGPVPTLVMITSRIMGQMGLLLIIRSLSRNLLRTALTYLAIFSLVVVITSIWSMLTFLDQVTREKESNLKAIITEKNQIPSQMRPSHEAELRALIKQLPTQYQPKNGDDDMMTWAFVGGSLDPKNRTPQNSLFLFCMEPRKLLTMMDGLEDLTGEQKALLQKGMDAMEEDQTRIILGKERLAQIGKRVGDTIELSSFNYVGITFKLKIIGVFPEGRYDQSAVMNRKYLENELLSYAGVNGGKEHPLADKCLNLIWLRLPNKEAFEVLAERVNSGGKFNPAVKMETASSAIGSFLEPFKDLVWGMRWILAPALLATMTLVISNAISISVRERRTEMAVLKVLGFRPWMVVALVLGEALIIGAISGFMATATAFAAINALGGIPLPIAFFPKFFVPAQALWWGPTIGACTAVLGSLLPAWTAKSVKASEIFAKVA